MADTKFLMILITILTMFTLTTGLIIQSYTSWNETGTDSYTPKCPSGSLCLNPYDPLGTLITGSHNLKTNSFANISWFKIDKKDVSVEDSWIWNSGIGYISQASGSFTDKYIKVKYMTPDSNGYYQVNYTINVSQKKTFKLNIWGMALGQIIDLEFSDDNVRIPSIIPYQYTETYPSPGQFTLSPLTVITRYNPVTNHLLVSTSTGLQINSNPSGTDIALLKYGIFGGAVASQTRYMYMAGIGTKENGVTLEEINPGSLSIPENAGSSDFLKFIGGAITGVAWNLVPFHEQIADFARVLTGLATFKYASTGDMTGEPMVPWFITVLMDIILIAIVAWGIQLLRGN